jgi:hypothetical protein
MIDVFDLKKWTKYFYHMNLENKIFLIQRTRGSNNFKSYVNYSASEALVKKPKQEIFIL